MAINLDDLQPYTVTDDLTDKIWLFYGDLGTRKTSVSCKFPKSLLIAFDIGYKLITDGDFIPAPVQTWQDVKSIVKQLDSPKNKERFKTVIIDTIGMAYQACYNYTCTQAGVEDPSDVGFGKVWRKIRNNFETVIRSIVQKGYGLVMLAHSDEVEKEDKITKKKVTAVKIDIDRRPDLIIKQLADFVLYLQKEEVEGSTVPTVFAYSDIANIDTKRRARFFTPKFEFTYENLQIELKNAIDKQYAIEGKTAPDNVVQSNPYVAAEIDFNELKKSTIDIATQLIQTVYATEMNDLLGNVFNGIRLTEVPESEDNKNKLAVVYDSLVEIKNKAGL